MSHTRQARPSQPTRFSPQRSLLLKLKKVQILGFKSFCDRTEIHLPAKGSQRWWARTAAASRTSRTRSRGCLASSRPRACAASRWRTSSLPGRATASRLGMAEVSLTLVDPEVYDGAALGDEPVRSSIDERTCRAIGTRRSCASRPPPETEEAVAEAQPG